MKVRTTDPPNRIAAASDVPGHVFWLPAPSISGGHAGVPRLPPATGIEELIGHPSNATFGTRTRLTITERPARSSPRRGWEPRRVLLGTGEGGGVAYALTPPPLSARQHRWQQPDATHREVSAPCTFEAATP
jgi:hypothetical protein